MGYITQYFAMPDPHVPGIFDATANTPSDWMFEAFGRTSTDSGISVTADSALTFAPWFQGISTIAASVAMVPLDVYERAADDNRIKHRDHAAYELLNRRANRVMTAFTVREILQAHALSWGNGYAAIVSRGSEPAELVPLMPDVTEPVRTADGGVAYETTLLDGTKKVIAGDNVLHIKGLGYDGLKGYSVFRYARNSLGLGIAAERYGARHFKNNAQPNVVLKYPARLSKEDADQLLEQWERRHSGVANAARPALVSGGLDVVPMSMSNEDSQWLQSREFQRTEVASWLCIPPIKLGIKASSYNSVEAEERAYVSQTLMRWFRRWEAEGDVKLLSGRQQRAWWYMEHQSGALIQGDFTTQANVAVNLKNAMIITRNEARKKFNLNAVDGGDDFENSNTTSGSVTPTSDTAANAANDLIRDRAEHLVKTECNSVRRLQDAADLDGALRSFYDQFQMRMASALRPCIRMYRALGCEAADADVVAEWYCRLSLDTLSDTIASVGSAGIVDECNQWPERRPADLLTRITGGEL